MTDHVEVRSGTYADSVGLMQVSGRLREVDRVRAALVAMGTPLNLGLLADLGFELPGAAGPNDLVVALRADDDEAVAAGLERCDAELARLRSAVDSGGFGAAEPPRTTASALGRTPEAGLALVSVPGPNAYAEARDAVDAGRSVMIFSDNVPLAEELSLKEAARDAGVLVMGPDCGTAVVGGVALGFANRVEPGAVGLVAASGTGAQQVMCLLDAAGVGVSHCLGVGGRDLSAAIGGLSTRLALAALDADPATERIVLVSKPAAPEVVAGLDEVIAGLDTPVEALTLAPGAPDLTSGVERVLGELGVDVPAWPAWPSAPADPAEPADRLVRGPYLRGLFCGGTLAYEATILASEALGDIRSNIPLDPELALDDVRRSTSHVVVDFGDDELTRGRPHPMIDPGLRLERIATEAADPECGVLLLDLVLGFGADPDPAPGLAEAIRAARATAAAAGRDLPVVVTLVGTDSDPQGLQRCGRALAEAGAEVHLSNAAATRHALRLLAKES